MLTSVALGLLGGCSGPSHDLDAGADARERDSGSDAGSSGCEGSYWSGRFQTPFGGIVDVSCGSLWEEEFAMLYDPRFCTYNGTTLQSRDERLRAGFGIHAEPSAYDGVGPIEPGVHMVIESLDDDWCGPERRGCHYNAYEYLYCEADVLEAGLLPGDTVEFRLTSPCDLVGGDGADGPYPVVLDLRVRARLTDLGRPDSSLCDRDGGT